VPAILSMIGTTNSGLHCGIEIIFFFAEAEIQVVCIFLMLNIKDEIWKQLCHRRGRHIHHQHK